MHIDSSEIDKDSVRECDLCIVGGGAAGITLANEFKRSKRQVCVLESGGFSRDSRTQALYAGEAQGRFLEMNSKYLSYSRLRYFGGSTNHWGGWCRPLDAIDFTARPWVPYSGWPFSRAALDGYYIRASRLLEIANFAEEYLEEQRAAELLLKPDAKSTFISRAFHFSPPVRFGKKFKEDIIEAKNVTLITNATALEIMSPRESTNGRIEVPVASLEGSRFTIRAKKVVIATGGVENARLMLLSREVDGVALGNRHDLVGRFFSDHAQLAAGFLALHERTPSFDYFRLRTNVSYGHPVRPVLAVRESIQREEKLLNTSIQLDDLHRSSHSIDASSEPLIAAQSFLRTVGSSVRRRRLDPPLLAMLMVRFETAPDPQSRITLASETDALGLQRAKLHWSVGSADAEYVRRALRLLACEFGATDKGRVQLLAEDSTDPWEAVHRTRGSNHHIGTTRMGSSPEDSVVDQHCQVHGVPGVYVAGSSVFPTGGYANPTFTIVALALKLADHLKNILKTEG